MLDVVERSADLHGEARITMTSSQGYIAAKKLDYAALQTAVPKDGTSLLHLSGGFQRYVDSKLAVLYFAMELNKRVRARKVENVYINACHPGKCELMRNRYLCKRLKLNRYLKASLPRPTWGATNSHCLVQVWNRWLRAA